MSKDNILSLANVCEERGLFGLYYTLAAMHPGDLSDGFELVEAPLYSFQCVIEMPMEGGFPVTAAHIVERPMFVGLLENLRSDLDGGGSVPYVIQVFNEVVMVVMDCLNPTGHPDNPWVREVGFTVGI
jgi:hypothetical protein